MTLAGTLRANWTANTYTATIYYNSNATLGSTTIATKTATCTVSNTAGNCSVIIPDEVKNSVGTYNNAYAGLRAISYMLSDIAGTITLTANKDFYTDYSSPITIRTPSSTSVCSSQTYYRNQWFISATEMSDTFLSTSNVNSSNVLPSNVNVTPTLPSGYSFSSLRTAVNNGGTIYTIADAVKTTTNTYYTTGVKTTTITATFYYNSNTTVGSATISSTANTGIKTEYLYCSTSSVATTSVTNGDITIPSTVTNSVGKYNSPYAGLSTSTGNMTAAVNATATKATTSNNTYYAIYRQPVTIYRPLDTSGQSTCIQSAYYRNEWLSSSSGMADPVLSTSTTGISNSTPLTVTGYTFRHLKTGFNNTGTIYTVANAAKTNINNFKSHEWYTTTVTGTFYYNSNATMGSTTISSTTRTGNRVYEHYCKSSTAPTTTITNGNISVPDVVTNSVGTYNNANVGVSSGANMTAVTPTTANTKYYAIYRSTVTRSYWSGSAWTTGSVYRNQWFTNTSTMSFAVLASSTTGTVNFTPGTYGPNNAIYSSYEWVETIDGPAYGGIESLANYEYIYTNIYDEYSYIVYYSLGSNVSSVGGSNTEYYIECKFRNILGNNPTTCNVTLPSITPKTGYTSVGWSTTNGATTGTPAGSTYTVSASNIILYANAVDITPPTISSFKGDVLSNYSIKATISATDTGSGMATSNPYGYAVTSSKPTCSGTTTSLGSSSFTPSPNATYTLTNNGNGYSQGTWYICAYAKDADGNTSYTSTSVVVDRTPPTVNYIVAGGTNSNGIYGTFKTITISANDTGGSGFDHMEVTLYNETDGFGKTQSVTNTVYTVVLNSDDHWTVFTNVYDKAGNKQTQSPSDATYGYYQSYIIDTTPPRVDAYIQPNGTNNVYVGINATDDNGIQRISIRVVHSTRGTLTNTTISSSSWSSSFPYYAGTYTVYVQAVDNANITQWRPPAQSGDYYVTYVTGTTGLGICRNFNTDASTCYNYQGSVYDSNVCTIYNVTHSDCNNLYGNGSWQSY